MEITSHRGIPSWLEAEPEKLCAKVVRDPVRGDVIYEIEEDKITALYSK